MRRVGIDVGGTFTDLFAWDQSQAGWVRTAKTLSTPEDPSIGVMNALRVAGIAPAEIGMLIHGTTIATNALIERKYPEPAMVTTAGFRDTIEIRRQRRQRLYDPYQVKPRPLIRRARRFTVTEKLGADGSTVRPLDRDEARRVAEQIAELGIKNIAVAFINSYVDGRHEQEMREILLDVIPDAQIALSSETRPKVRELGRFITTAVRAALFPVIGDYLTRLEGQLADHGFRGQLYIVKSNGGMMTSALAKARPEELIESGPAGGIAAGRFLAQVLDIPSMIVTDVGGTSFEASLMEGGRGLMRDDYEIEWEMPLITPMLDIRSIGAGGGSIAWIDDGGSLRVGPQSAGADPGPACYRRGGTQPTVTDANLVLGRIDPNLGGKFALDVEAARRAIAQVAEPLGLSIEDCAEGIIEIASENMAGAIRMVSTDRGRDPRDQTLLAFGGAGGMHAPFVAAAAGIDRIIVPPFAGVACAFGATIMDVQHDLEATFYAEARSADLAALNRAYADLEQEVLELMAREGVESETIVLERSAQMRYVGQSYEVTTPVPAGELDSAAVEQIIENFHREHEREYGVFSASFDVAFVTLRVTGTGVVAKPEASVLASSLAHQQNGHQGSLKETRGVYFAGTTHDAEIHDADLLVPGQVIAGPAVIEQADDAIVLPPGTTAEVDQYRNVVVQVRKE